MTAVFHRLLLLRHAQADRPPHTRDYDRPLSPLGEQEASEIGAYLAQEGLLPELALVSGAQRTRATWGLVQKQLPNLVPAIFEDRIYEANPSVLLETLRGVSSEPPAVLLVGHNPGLQLLALQLVGRGGRTAYSRLRQEFPPAALAVIDFEIAEWSRVSEQSGALERFAVTKS